MLYKFWEVSHTFLLPIWLGFFGSLLTFLTSLVHGVTSWIVAALVMTVLSFLWALWASRKPPRT